MKTIKLSESELHRIIKNVISEQKSERYMFFSNLEQIRRQCDLLLELNQEEIEGVLDDGHDWAQDHIAEAKNNMDQVFDFLMNETKRYHKMSDEVVMSEGKLDFILGKPISLIKRLHTTKYNPNTDSLEKVTKDEMIDGEIVKIIDDDPFSVPVLVVKSPNQTSRIMYEKNKDRFIDGESSYLYQYIPQTPKDERTLTLFKNNYYDIDDEMVMSEGNSKEITEKKKKNTPTNPSLWKQSLAWAKQRYEVCPSAYCNGAAVKRYNSKGGKWKKK
jgi:hypothetical protein